MPYKPFEPKDTFEKAMSKLWGDPREFNPTTRLEEMLVKIAKENPVPTGKKTIDSTAEVDVSSYATAQVVDANLTAENIKKDVVILGTTGSYEGGGSSDFSYMTETTVTLNTGEHNSFTLGVSWADIMAGTTVYYFVADAAFVSHMNSGTAGHCIAVIVASDSDGYYAQAVDLSISNYMTVFHATYEGSDTTQHPTFELFD